MTPTELAKKLNGSEYPEIGSRELFEAAKQANLLVVFGHSDDLMEFRGAIDDEVGAWEGGTAMLHKGKIHINECSEQERCPNWQGHPPGAVKVEAIWNDEELPAWTFNADVPGLATFEVIEDGEVFQRGIVFSMDGI